MQSPNLSRKEDGGKKKKLKGGNFIGISEEREFKACVVVMSQIHFLSKGKKKIPPAQSTSIERPRTSDCCASLFPRGGGENHLKLKGKGTQTPQTGEWGEQD